MKRRRKYITRPLHLRIMDSIDAASGCWIWLRTFGRDGYGRMGIKGKMRLAHRVSYETFVGPIPDGMYVCHRCDDHGCVRPEHLFLGTQADNIRDMWRKGRARVPTTQSGSANYNARLDPSVGKTIRHLYFAERRSQQEIGDFYGINQAYVSRIVRKLAWEGKL